MNFIDCTYERSNGKAVLKHDGFNIDVTNFKEKIEAESTGSELLFCIRPEDVSIHDRPEGDNPVQATVYVIEPLGSKTVVDMEVADNVIKGIGPGFAQYTMGDSKWVKFDMTRAHVIDKGTEKVIF
ncbi:MAG: TOBE domain-containing protein [Chloroflexi bacterium]|nr:TOBE domain-containing protein [Chloroflexota bacterium]